MSGIERVVIFDIDGGLADLSAFAHRLTVGDSDGNRRQGWQRIFEHVGQAAVIEPGRELVEAVAGLGFVPVYSTTRPVSSAGQTRLWLGEHGISRISAGAGVAVPVSWRSPCGCRGQGRALSGRRVVVGGVRRR